MEEVELERCEQNDDESSQEEEEVEKVEQSELSGFQLTESSQIIGGGEVEEKNVQLETLEEPPCTTTEELITTDQHAGDDLTAAQDQEMVSHQEVSAIVATQGAKIQTQTQLQPTLCPPTLSESSPTSAQSPTLAERKYSSSKVNNGAIVEANQRKSSNLNPLSIVVVPAVKSPVSDGYNWRKYGQKQVKSPQGSRSYYKCSKSDCSAKKIECSDHTGHVVEIVNKGLHSHDPAFKINSLGDRPVCSERAALGNIITENRLEKVNDPDPPLSSKEPAQEKSVPLETKRPNSAGSEGNGELQAKEEHNGEPEPKRMKKGNLERSAEPSKPGKQPKFVVHAAGDVGISGDGYRWRKYGQKMVKGNPHPRNYYRCTSAGCPVRKHIESAVDNINAVIITYKGVHDHDMPVPKKRHGPPSAPLIAASSPASMNPKKNDSTIQNQTDHQAGGENNKKVVEPARTLLSIGFEIKPC
ncbi:probable WRKY transcription factor 32 [Rutidosis leptorrhynchoides]|uniref:probable WRKY transcription factor 32 n=1 Tax=Rutidosis leptorrhynchoides TaxID=125765 RepID=UPI003A9A2338